MMEKFIDAKEEEEEDTKSDDSRETLKEEEEKNKEDAKEALSAKRVQQPCTLVIPQAVSRL